MVSSTRKKSTSEGNHGAQFSPKNVVHTTGKSKLSPKFPSASSPMSQGRKMLRSSESVSTTPTRRSRRVTGDAELDMKSQVQTPAKSPKNLSKDLNNSPVIQTPGRRSRRISTGNALASLDDVSKATPLKKSKLNVKTPKTPTPTKQQQKLSSEDEATSPANQTSTISLVKKLVLGNETEQNTQTPTRRSRRLSLSVNEPTQGTPTRGRPPKRLSVSNDEAAQSTPTQTKRSKMLSTLDEPTKGTPTRGRPPKMLSVSNVEAAESTPTQTKRSKRLSTSDAEPTKGTPAQNKLSLNDEPEPIIGTPAQNKKKVAPTTPTSTTQTRRQSTSNNEPNLATPPANKQSKMLSTSKGEQEVAAQKATRLSRRLSTSTNEKQEVAIQTPTRRSRRLSTSKDEQEVAIQTPTRRSGRLSTSKDEQEVTIQTPTRRSGRLSTSRDDKTDIDQSAGKSLKRSFKDGSKEGSPLVIMPNKRNKNLNEDNSTATLLIPTQQTRRLDKKQDDIDSVQTDRAVKSESVEDGQVSVEETEEGKVGLDCEEPENYGENSQVTNTENNTLDIIKKVDEVVSADQEERKNGSCRTSSLEVIMEADEIGNEQAEEDSGSKISPEYNEQNECEPTEMQKSSVSAYLNEQKIEEVTAESATEENPEIVTEIKPDDSSDVKQCENDSTEKSEMDKRAGDSKEEISQECNEEQENKEEISQECNEEQENKEISQECNEEQENKEEISQESKEEISQECNEEQESKEEISQECNEEQECQSELSKIEASHKITTESKLNNNNIDSSDGKLYDNNSDKVASSTENKIGETEDIVSTTVTSAQASSNSLTCSPYLREIESESLVGEEQVTSTTDISASTSDDQENTPVNDIQPQLQVGSNLKIANNTQKLSRTQPMEEARKIRGMPISGRWWKTEKKRSGSIYKDKPFNTSWAKKMQLKQNRKNVMAADAAIKAEKQRRTEELKARRLLNKQRREENARKAEIVQLIKNTSKIKKMKKKHLKYLQKRDTSSM